MELEILEGLALSADRARALAQLLPGSEEHDYYRGLHAQHAGALDDADAILAAWPERHGATQNGERLRWRQLLYRLGDDDAARAATAADDLRDRLSVSHWHEAEVAEVDPTRPSRLPAGAFEGIAQLQHAAGIGTDLAQVTDEGCQELVGWKIDPQRRRVLLARIGHTPHPALVEMIADDFDVRGSGGFGSLAVHSQLTRSQLERLAERRPSLRAHAVWVAAMVQRMRPPASVDLELDRDAREAYLAELWAFASTLPPAGNSLKAHILWHLLDACRRRGVVDRTASPSGDASREPSLALVRERFAAYLQLPRNATYVARDLLVNVTNAELVQLGADFRDATALPPAGDDETLVRDLVHLDPDHANAIAPWLERAWLDRELATAALLAGAPDAERATLALGPARAAALRERVDLAWCAHNPTQFAAGEPVALDVDVKNVPELVVKVFRVDPIAYFEHHKREVNTDLDLDGLAASDELVLRYAEPPIRRVRRHLELPMCARPGTYVIDLIGNGMSSRAVVRSGRLRHVVRVGAAGQVITILDDAATMLPGARAWIGDREYIADERGEIVVPFSTRAQRVPMLLVHGDITSVAHLELRGEVFALQARVVLERESLAAGRTARAIVRLSLTVGGAPASLALLERAMWHVTLTDRQGVAVTKSQPLVARDDDASVLEWPMGDNTATVALSVNGVVSIVSEQRELELTDGETFAVATIHGEVATEALYLARTAAGWVVSALGKTGEPRARRPVTIGLRHVWSRVIRAVELATDDAGRVELGELDGIDRITASIGGLSCTWDVADRGARVPPIVRPAGGDITLALPALRDAASTIARTSLVELRGAMPARHVDVELVPLAGAVAIPALPPGDYAVRAPGLGAIPITIVEGVAIGTSLVTAGAVLERSRTAPVIATLEVGDAAIDVGLRDVSPRTRVHAIATRFAPAPIRQAQQPPPLPLARRSDRARAALYVSGRELGDEYRYILDRRAARRYPGLLLDRPSLLLHPWARRTTTTDVATAKPGGRFGAAPAASMAAQGYGGAAARSVGVGATDLEAYATHDFLATAPAVLANLVPDDRGHVSIARAALGDATHVTIVVDDPAGWSSRGVPLAEAPLAPRDLRLRVALAADRHATQRKDIATLRSGGQLVIEDLATAKVHVLDSLERAHGYLCALRDDPTLRDFAFVTRWHALPADERAERYSKYACHELHLFLYVKDRAFFDAVVRPTLVHKRVKTFLDHWLLGADLAAYVEPVALARLNAVERALLASRLPADGPLLARLLADEVATIPPDPARDTRLIDALLGASALDGNHELVEAQAEAFAASETTGEYPAAGPMSAPAPQSQMMMKKVSSHAAPRAAPAPPAPPPQAPAPSRARATERSEPSFDDADLGDDAKRRAASAPMYRAIDRTQEWAETSWWKRTPAESRATMIAPSRLWRDLALHAGGPSGFLSPHLGLATNSFAEAMCALAVIDLPFVAGAHAIVADGPRLTITAASAALVGTSQIVDAPLAPSGPPIVVGTSYVRSDDRYQFIDGERVERYVTGELATGVVYACLVVLANPSSARQRVSALVQIPRGSIAVGGARTTHTLDVVLEPYGTHGHEYAFYFAQPGTWSHFPVHVARGGAIIAAAPPATLEVTAGGATADTTSWPYVSQRGTLADVIAALAGDNLAALELARVAWRLKDRAAYDAILGALEARRAFHPVLWAYALLHRDRARIRTWLRTRGDDLRAGPVLDMAVVGLDAEDLGLYEHLEMAPLINARAHALGGKLRILNDGLAAQYRRFLDLVAHRVAPTAEDLLAATAYLLAQDRAAAAHDVLARVDASAVVDQMQHAYLAAYAACLAGEVARARTLAAPWRDVPILRWRRRFEALLAMLDEVAGISAPAVETASVIDPRGRDAQLGDLAASQPTFDIAVDASGVLVRQQHVAELELRYFEMDIELLFSRQPFVASDVSRFSFIAPGHRESVVAPAAQLLVPWPAALRGKNVVVEAVGAGRRAAKVHYANDLATTLAHQFGQIRVQRATDRGALPATYVKVYARGRDGNAAFYKDGYTDLRGWFDYATLSTDDLDRVERFAILVCSDAHGAAILEATPPQR